jgi:hypothetical protein
MRSIDSGRFTSSESGRSTRKYLGPLAQFWIQRCVAGHVAPCGCLLGVYESFNGRVVRVVDHRADGCDAHTTGQMIE